MADDDALDAIAGELYGLPLEEFVRARDARAKELRGAGDRELATAVKALPKPGVVVWALNQVARAHEPCVGAIVQSADQLRTTGDVGAWRALSDRYSDLVHELVHHAARILEEQGHATPPDRLNALAGAIRTAVTGPDRAAFRAGRLTGEPVAGEVAEDEDEEGGGDSMWSMAAAAVQSMPSGGPERRAREDGARPAPEARRSSPTPTSRRSAEDRDRAAERRARAEAELAAAEREARDLLEAARHAERERDEAARAMAQAEREHDHAERAAERAARDAERATRKVERLRAKLDD